MHKCVLVFALLAAALALAQFLKDQYVSPLRLRGIDYERVRPRGLLTGRQMFHYWSASLPRFG